MESLRRRAVKRTLDWARMFGILLLAALVSAIPPIQHTAEAIDRHRDQLVPLAAGVAGIGFVMLMGAVLSMLATSGHRLSHAEGGLRATLGREVTYETSFTDMKGAWRSGDWRRDAHWRRLFTAASGAALLLYGLFGIFVAAGPGLIKVVAAGAIAYATLRTAVGFWRA